MKKEKTEIINTKERKAFVASEIEILKNFSRDVICVSVDDNELPPIPFEDLT